MDIQLNLRKKKFGIMIGVNQKVYGKFSILNDDFNIKLLVCGNAKTCGALRCKMSITI